MELGDTKSELTPWRVLRGCWGIVTPLSQPGRENIIFWALSLCQALCWVLGTETGVRPALPRGHPGWQVLSVACSHREPWGTRGGEASSGAFSFSTSPVMWVASSLSYR